MWDTNVYLTFSQIQEWFCATIGMNDVLNKWASDGKIKVFDVKELKPRYLLSSVIEVAKNSHLPKVSIRYRDVSVPGVDHGLSMKDEVYCSSHDYIPPFLYQRYSNIALPPQLAHILEFACYGFVSHIRVQTRSELPEKLNDELLRKLIDSGVLISTSNPDEKVVINGSIGQFEAHFSTPSPIQETNRNTSPFEELEEYLPIVELQAKIGIPMTSVQLGQWVKSKEIRAVKCHNVVCYHVEDVKEKYSKKRFTIVMVKTDQEMEDVKDSYGEDNIIKPNCGLTRMLSTGMFRRLIVSYFPAYDVIELCQKHKVELVVLNV